MFSLDVVDVGFDLDGRSWPTAPKIDAEAAAAAAPSWAPLAFSGREEDFPSLSRFIFNV